MDDNDLQKFSQSLIAVGEIYNRRISPAMLELYFDTLKDFTVEQVSNAIKTHIADPDTSDRDWETF